MNDQTKPNIDTLKEMCLDRAADANMLKWDLKLFKRSHPHLFAAIMDAMELYKQANKPLEPWEK